MDRNILRAVRLAARFRPLMSIRTLGAASAVLLGAVACGHAGPGAVVPTPIDNGVDVASQNLPPEKELDALLSGKRAGGGAVRIAIPPFHVLGAGAEWMGEAASLVAMSRLSREDGISVLDRNELTKLIEEIRRNDAADPKQLARTGKLLGAQQLLLGSLVDEGKGKMRLIVRPVRVEDGVSRPSIESDVRVDQWVEDVEAALGAMVAALRPGGDPSAAGAPAQEAAPLDPASAEKGGRASALAAKGQLVDAQPLFEQALSKPSSAWSLEAEYVEVMNDLGMRAWSSERARSVMARMPKGATTACARARLQIEQTRDEYKVDDARDAIRLAAACGDKVVEARALRVYAFAVRDIDHKAARVAYERALALLGAGDENGWERCWIEEGQYNVVGIDGLALTDGHDDDRYEEIAKRCEAAGALYVAARTYNEAASNALLPKHAEELLDRGLAAGKLVGGEVYDSLMFAHANQLRNAGQPSKADDIILAVMGGRLRAIAVLAGGLPETELSIDDELLKRAGVADPKAKSQGVPEGAKLLVQAHRLGLAKAVRNWADRTDRESARQAKAYRAVADALDPPKTKVPENETGGARLERRLAEAGIPSEQLAKGDAAPLRGSVKSLVDAHDALWDRFWELRGTNAAPDELRRVADGLDKVARWHGSPRLAGNALRVEARASADAGHRDDALALLQKAHQLVTIAPWFEVAIMADEAECESDPAKARAVRAARPAVAKKSSLNAWVGALRDSVRDDSKTDHAACQPGLEALVAAAKELDEEGIYETAAYALAQAAFTANECENSDGSARALDLQADRLAVLEKLADPLRSLQGLNDVLRTYRNMIWHTYRGSTNRMMRFDSRARAMVEKLRSGAEDLASNGRPRDAARVAGAIETGPDAVPAFLSEALGWTDRFKDSIEYPLLAASLHAQIGRASNMSDEEVRELTLARALYRVAGDPEKAAEVQRAIMIQYGASSSLPREYKKCWDIAKGDAHYIDSCVKGLADGIAANGLLAFQDKALLQAAIKASMDALPVWDTWGAQYRMDLRTNVATLALAAGDMASFHRFDDEVRAYYTKVAPDSYQLVTHITGLTEAALAVDSALYFKLWHDFVDAHGASAFWESGSLLDVAQEARRLKNADEERFFLERGRQRSLQNATYAHNYARDGVGAALATKSWAQAVKKYEEAQKLVTRRRSLSEYYSFSIATVRGMAGDVGAARAALKPVVDRVLADGDSDSACFDSMVLETAASLAGAAHDCRAADAMKERAAASRARCTHPTDLDDGTFTDLLYWGTLRAPDKCSARFVPFATQLSGAGSDEITQLERTACDMGEADACSTAASHYRSGWGVTANAPLAATLAKKGCDGGNLDGCAALAEVTAEGSGVAKDEAQARALARSACQRGGAWACQVAGNMERGGTGGPVDEAGARAWYEKGCTLHDVASCEAVAEAAGAQ